MKKLFFGLLFGLVLSLFASSATTVFAYSPYLSVSGGTVTISGGQPNSSVVINYTVSGSSLQNSITGTTDFSGYFSVNVGSLVNQVSATVGGQTVSGSNSGSCTYNCGSPYGISLSQNNLYLTAGQSQSVTIYNNSYNNYGYGNYYISGGNISIATASISGNQVNVFAYQSGSTTFNICQSNYSGGCVSLYVSVTGNSGCYGNNCNSNNVWFNPSNPTMYVGQSLAVSINSSAYNYGYNYNNNSYYISSNSNPAAVSANVSGTVLNLYANQNGNSTINVCNSGLNFCGSIFVSVGGSNSGNITFSQSNVSLNVGQNSTVTVYTTGSNGNVYISSNSNPSVATASLSNNVIYITAFSSGSTNVQVCQNGNLMCNTLYVNVGGNCNYGNCNNLSLSQTNLSMSVGQNQSVTAYNNNFGTLYLSSNSNPNAVSVSINGSVINFYAINNGTAAVNICSNSYNQCASVYVNVGSGGYGNNITLTQSSLNLNVGQNGSVGISGSGGYYVSQNTSPSIVSTNIAGNTLYVNGLSYGSSTITVCQALGYSQCATLYVTVSGSGSNSGIWFSQSFVNLNMGQSMTVTIYSNNYGGNYYLSTNSNPSAASANVVGNQLNLSGNYNGGNSTITVCQSQSGSNSCGSIYVSVAGTGNCGYSNNCGSNNLSLSQTSLNLNQGQSASVSIYGGYGYYISSNSNSAVANATISGNVVNVYAGQVGSSTVQICQNTYNSCMSLSVTVSGTGGNVLGAYTYNSGQLINENGTVYIVYKNMKTAFASSYAFTGLGFSFANVLNAGYTNLTNSGYTVSSPYSQHPWGSWVKSGQAVYFVHQSGLIPVPDWNTFLNNGGQANLIVSANAWDFRTLVLSPMVSNDPRLQ